MIHWRELTTHGKIDAIRGVWFAGCSTAQIAANLMGVTRNAIIGMYHRFPNSLIDMPLTARGPIGPRHETREKRLRGIRKSRGEMSPHHRKPLPEPKFVATEVHLCGKPLMMLQAKECRWSVNDATGYELHLFCALPAEGTYCHHHKLRAYRPQTS
jgi:hypothetical protein